jgi:hypothetical protein
MAIEAREVWGIGKLTKERTRVVPPSDTWIPVNSIKPLREIMRVDDPDSIRLRINVMGDGYNMEEFYSGEKINALGLRGLTCVPFYQIYYSWRQTES